MSRYQSHLAAAAVVVVGVVVVVAGIAAAMVAAECLDHATERILTVLEGRQRTIQE